MKRILSIVLLSLICAENAHAYLDPGTGSILLQALLAGMLAVGAFWRNLKGYIKGFFTRNSQDDKDS